MRTASSPNLLVDATQLDALFATEGWQTLMTFARESAREYSRIICKLYILIFFPELAVRPSTSAPSSSTRMEEDIPPEVFDQIAAEEAARSGAPSAPISGGSRGVRVCPHCTYENDHGGSDCEVCGLPLG